MLPHSLRCVQVAAPIPAPWSWQSLPCSHSTLQPEEHHYFHFFSLRWGGLEKHIIVHFIRGFKMLWFIPCVLGVTFLGLFFGYPCSSVSAKHCMEVPRGRQPALPICSLQKKKTQLIIGSLYTACQDAWGLLNIFYLSTTTQFKK